MSALSELPGLPYFVIRAWMDEKGSQGKGESEASYCKKRNTSPISCPLDFTINN